MRLLAFLFAITAGFAAVPAAAATTVYAAGVLSQSGPVAGAGQVLGPADGLSAVIGRNGNLILALSGPTDGTGVTIAGARGPATVVQVSVGAIVSGVAVFTPVQNIAGGGVTVFDFSADCALLSAAGCPLLQINVLGGPSAQFTFDGVSAVGRTPEPSTWALLIMGFAGVAGRLKQLRRRGALGVGALVARPQFLAIHSQNLARR